MDKLNVNNVTFSYDGKVNVIDVTLIQRKLAGLPVSYPIGEAL